MFMVRLSETGHWRWVLSTFPGNRERVFNVLWCIKIKLFSLLIIQIVSCLTAHGSPNITLVRWSYIYMHCLHWRLQILILDGPPIIMTINFVATGASLSRQMLEDHARVCVPTLARMSSVRWCRAWPRGRGCLGWVLWPKLSLRSLNSRLSSSQLSPLLSHSAIT